MKTFITDNNRAAILARITRQCVADGDGASVCLIWGGATSRAGAPIINAGGRCRPVRRVVWEALHGSLPAPGIFVVAGCRNAACVSPDCLTCMSVLDLRRLDSQRGAYSRPDTNAARALRARRRAAIPEHVVQQVRDFEGTCAQAAQATGVSLSHCKNIRAGRARKPLGNVWGGLLA